MKVEMGAKVSLTHDEPENGLRPSVSYLFRPSPTPTGRMQSACYHRHGKRWGEMSLMKERVPTLAQDKESSVVHGMPGSHQTERATYVFARKNVATLAGW